jgi:crotonobetainyl-CoA:carnitine CoA-transferase CaiB-like acyl-CoA transferase
MIAVGSDRQFAQFCWILGRTDIASDARYTTNALRVTNRASLISALRKELRSWERNVLLAKLAASGVPAGPINTIAEVFSDPQVWWRAMRVDFDRPEVSGGRLSGLRTPIRFSSSPLCLDRPAPLLGEHTSAIARELGIDL